MSGLEVEVRGDAVRFRVRVSPRASRDAVGGTHDGALKVKLCAPPVEGAANAALVKVLAKELGVAKRDVRIVGGESSRDKHLEVVGASADAIRSLA